MGRIPPQGTGGGGIADKTILPPAATMSAVLQDGEHTAIRVNVPSGRTLKVWYVGVQNELNNAPTNLKAVVRDETNSTDIVSENAKFSSGQPLAEKAGAIDIECRARNDTGSEQEVSGYFNFTLE